MEDGSKAKFAEAKYDVRCSQGECELIIKSTEYFSEVPYSNQNLKKISIETDRNSENLYSKQLNNPENHHCYPP